MRGIKKIYEIAGGEIICHEKAYKVTLEQFKKFMSWYDEMRYLVCEEIIEEFDLSDDLEERLEDCREWWLEENGLLNK